MSSNNFCALPFGHTNIGTQGEFEVCCYHSTPQEYRININNKRIDHWLDSQYLQQVQKSFIDNQRHPGCNACWQREDLNLTSIRQRTAREYQILGVNKNTTYPVNIEIQLGNLCNLKCLMCNENWSSSILAENIKLKINNSQQKDFRWTDTGIQNLKDIISRGVRVLNIRGGEPFYNKDFLKIIESLPEDSCQNTILHITTNGTQWNEQWANALKKFRLVRMMFSVDAIDDLYEYIRFPGQWNQTQSNIDKIIQGKNIKPLIHCTVQNLNIGSIGKLIQWCQEKNLYLQFEQLTDPSWLELTNLPKPLKLKAIEHLSNISIHTLSDHLKQQIGSYYAQLTESLQKSDNLELWNQFQTQITLRDQCRNNSYRQFLPD